MKINKNEILSIIFFMLFATLTILILVVDVQTNPITGKEVGLYTINKSLMLDGPIKFFDLLSDVILGLCLLVVIIFIIVGLYQMIINKSFKKVDNRIKALIYVMIGLFIFWIIFDHFIIINHRPILIDKKVEGSYPSTHVMICTFVVCFVCHLLIHEVDEKMFNFAGYLSSILLIGTCCIGRWASNMHWATDVLGGLLLGLAAFSIFLKISEEQKVS